MNNRLSEVLQISETSDLNQFVVLISLIMEEVHLLLYLFRLVF
jgi:hypothetical protein